MDILKEVTIDRLTTESVSILTQSYIIVDDKRMNVGEKHRKAYANNDHDRAVLANEQSEDVVNAIFSIWGSLANIS